MKHVLATRCCDQRDPAPLFVMYEAQREIRFATFARRTNWKPVAKALGYAVGAMKGLHLRKDWHVRFFRAKWKGQPCYFMDWSGIDHIFLKRQVQSANLSALPTH